MRGNIGIDMYLRTARALSELVDLIKQAYAKPQGNTPEGVPTGFTATRGAAGAIGAINYEVRKAASFIEGVIGLSDSARYLRNLEFGERGTMSSPPGGALYSRTKAPPLENIKQWVKRAGIEVPKYFKELAAEHLKTAESGHAHPSFDKNRDKPWNSTDELVLYAYAIAQKRKRMGRAGMRVIERTIRQHTETIINLLEGRTA